MTEHHTYSKFYTTIPFQEKYWIFQKNLKTQFTIRRGTRDAHKGPAKLYLIDSIPTQAKSVDIVCVQQMRFIDIPVEWFMESWHAFPQDTSIMDVPYPAITKDDIYDIVVPVMQDIYGDSFNLYEIVTLIWFNMEDED